MAKYVITKVYVVEAESIGQAVQVLHLASRAGEDWLFQEQPDTVNTLTVATKAQGWLTRLCERLWGASKEDPRSIIL